MYFILSLCVLILHGSPMIMVELLDFPDSAPILTGFVTDQHYNPLIGATVMINGTSLGAMTDEDGQYFVTDVPPGIYAVVAHMVGMCSETIEEVALVEDQFTQLNFIIYKYEKLPGVSKGR